MKKTFKEAELDPKTDAEFAREKITEMRVDLLSAQYERIANQDQTLLIVVAGLEGIGKGTAVNTLNSWLDPRHVHSLAFGKPAPEEAARPLMWRYWNALPRKGDIGLVFGSWYSALIKELSRKHPRPAKISRYSGVIARFEAELAYQGVKVLKLWFHSSANAQEQRCQELLSNPDTAWRVSKADLKVKKNFKQIRTAALETMELSNTSHAPWVIVPAADPYTRDLTVAKAVLDALQNPISDKDVQTPPSYPDYRRSEPVSLVNLKQTKQDSKKEHHESELAHLQGRLSRLLRSKNLAAHSLALVFEGQDAAGKGGVIKRITSALDVRHYDVHPIAAPDSTELSRPYLWRFWRHAPTAGKVAIFDRSWYGRVLVERVEKYATVPAWQRAYNEINEFEAQWSANGTIVLKFWLAVSSKEQLARFHEREQTPFKNYKITDDDWRNRKKWPAYRRAAEDMFRHTDTEYAPWHIIPSDDKKAARIQVLKLIIEHLESLHSGATEQAFVQPDSDVQFSLEV